MCADKVKDPERNKKGKKEKPEKCGKDLEKHTKKKSGAKSAKKGGKEEKSKVFCCCVGVFCARFFSFLFLNSY